MDFKITNDVMPEKGKSKDSLCLQCIGASDTSGNFQERKIKTTNNSRKIIRETCVK